MTTSTLTLAALIPSLILNVGLLYLYFRSQRDMKKLRGSYHRVIFELEKMRSDVRGELQNILENLQKHRESVETLLETLQSESEVEK